MFGADDYLKAPLDRLVVEAKLRRLVSPIPKPDPQCATRMSVLLDIPVKIRELSELGLSFLSSSYFPKSVLIHCRRESLVKIDSRFPEFKAVAVSSLPHHSGGGYETFAEFLDPSDELRFALRTWLASQG
jgi:hypothetical protein